MQVTSNESHVNHVVVGGMKPINFSINQSADFFHILSTSLYTNPKLAMIRETICNAWDAHIKAGITDTPIVVTLTDKITIKDFGSGISHDDMGLHYGTYGYSTKKDDGNQTGGFGLGCKSPFAYTNNFQVTSCNDGTKTVYSLNKPCNQSEDSPSIIPIVSLPTDETGLTISIPLVHLSDSNVLITYIKDIIFNGDIKATFNGSELPILGLTSGYYLLTDRLLNTCTNKIYVRYGSVIYPVPYNDYYGYLYQKLSDFINDNFYAYNYKIVFQAPNDSLCITPSRESLSMQGNTLETIKSLLKTFLAEVTANFESAKLSKLSDHLDTLINSPDKHSLLFSIDSNAIAQTVSISNMLRNVSNIGDMAQATLINMVASNKINRPALLLRISKMIKANIITGRSADKLIDAIQTQSNNWLGKYIMYPLVDQMKTLSLMDPTRLYSVNNPGYYQRSGNIELTKVKASTVNPDEALGYLRKVVIVSPIKNLSGQNLRILQKQNNLPIYCSILYYHISTKKGARQAAKDFFMDQGMTVIEYYTPTKLTARTPKTKTVGLPALSDLLVRGQFKDSAAGKTLLTSPESVIRLNIVSSVKEGCLPNWNRESSLLLIKIFGDKVGIAKTDAQYDKYIAKGAIKFSDYVTTKIVDYISNNKNTTEYYNNSPELLNQYAQQNTIYLANPIKMLKIVSSVPSLCLEFGITNNISDTDRDYINLALKSNKPVLDNIFKTTKTIVLPGVLSNFIAVVNKADEHKYESLNIRYILNLLQVTPQKPEILDYISDLVKLTLK